MPDEKKKLQTSVEKMLKVIEAAKKTKTTTPPK